MTHEDVLQRTKAYIQDNFLYMRRDFALESETSLLRDGVLDSMGVMELVQYLEDTFGIRVGEDDITEANLGTPQAIASYVAPRLVASRLIF